MTWHQCLIKMLKKPIEQTLDHLVAGVVVLYFMLRWNERPEAAPCVCACVCTIKHRRGAAVCFISMKSMLLNQPACFFFFLLAV